MKRLFVLCLVLVLSLTSCEINLPECGNNPDDDENKLPRSEAFAISQLINVEDVAYVEYRVDYWLSSSIPTPYLTDDVDSFFNLLDNENADAKFITDIEDTDDLFDEQFKAAWESLRMDEDGNLRLADYVQYTLMNENKKTIALGNIYPNGTVGITVLNLDSLDPLDPESEFYVTEVPLGINLAALVQYVNESREAEEKNS